MFVVGTAGHVDHGKSTLVQSLTGIDPDRLLEEKERGLTIDLGFAWMTLPDGREVSLIDVPGHERFVSNMVAGVGAIDMALLVVSADESVMPQTREHLAILDLLGISRAISVITKCDLAEPELVELVEAEIDDLLSDTPLAGSPCVAVSAVSGQGIDHLSQEMARLLLSAAPRSNRGRPRMSVDRSFTMSGFGTVVTGTLLDGSLRVGDEVELAVSGARARIRGLQSHRVALEEVLPGRRVAVNLSRISHDTIDRGEVLATPGGLRPTTSVDVRLTTPDDLPRPLRHNMRVTVHCGSAETVGTLRLLEDDHAQAGETVWAQLKIASPVAVLKGDRIVIRSNRTTLGGGTIVDTHARRHRRRHSPTLDRLATLDGGTAREAIQATIDLRGPISLKALVTEASMELDELAQELSGMVEDSLVVALGSDPTVFYLSSPAWMALVDAARRSVDDYHRRHPARWGEPKEELRNKLGLEPGLFGHALDRLVGTGILAETGAQVRLPSHRPKLSEAQRTAADAFLMTLQDADSYSPPTDGLPDEDVLEILEAEGRVVRVGPSVVFTAAAFEDMLGKVRAHASEHGQVTVADVRDMLRTSRKYALALMEHLDRTRITRRVGDARVLREP